MPQCIFNRFHNRQSLDFKYESVIKKYQPFSIDNTENMGTFHICLIRIRKLTETPEMRNVYAQW